MARYFDADDLIDAINEWLDSIEETETSKEAIKKQIQKKPKNYEETIVWHEIVTRPMTPEEREEFGEAEYYLDCVMPEDGQEILVATKFGTDTDISRYDGGYYLEGLGSWDDVIAWAEMPKYKVERKKRRGETK